MSASRMRTYLFNQFNQQLEQKTPKRLCTFHIVFGCTRVNRSDRWGLSFCLFFLDVAHTYTRAEDDFLFRKKFPHALRSTGKMSCEKWGKVSSLFFFFSFLFYIFRISQRYVSLFVFIRRTHIHRDMWCVACSMFVDGSIDATWHGTRLWKMEMKIHGHDMKMLAFFSSLP